MFFLGPIEIVLLLVVAVAVEVALFWAAAGIGDAPPIRGGKLLLVSLAATTACAAVGGAIAWSLRAESFLAPENRMFAFMTALLGLLVTWVIPGIVYAPLVPVSIPRGMFIAVVQVLLRLFLYILIAAVVFVILAIVQIARGTDAHVEATASALTHALTLAKP